ncbi:hypothetical protein FACS189437_02980 [Bacteroidia bacterium]|nr:hypothetical protein FACS189437_02980 [Bacteroidia bacterium]
MAGDDFEKEIDVGVSSKKSKDFWLFLIFIDIIALVFFCFLIYWYLSEKFNASAPGRENVPVIETAAGNTSAPPQMQPQVITSAPEIAAPTAVPVEPVPPPVQPAPPAPVAQPVTPPSAPPQKAAQKRQSVFIEPTKSYTRKVTFKYFGPAKSVSIVSGFTMTKPQPLKKVNGAWEGSFIIYPGEYKYLFVVDGVQTLDPNTEEKDGRSFIVIP